MNNKQLKLSLLATLILISCLTLAPGLVLAGYADTVKDGLSKAAGAADISKIGDDSSATAGLTNFLGIVINYLFGAVAVVFLAVIMIGGYFWMAAQGNDEQVAKAKKFILNGIFGLTVIFLSYALVYTILFSLNAATTSSN